jgi:hypothetical protein
VLALRAVRAGEPKRQPAAAAGARWLWRRSACAKSGIAPDGGSAARRGTVWGSAAYVVDGCRTQPASEHSRSDVEHRCAQSNGRSFRVHADRSGYTRREACRDWPGNGGALCVRLRECRCRCTRGDGSCFAAASRSRTRYFCVPALICGRICLTRKLEEAALRNGVAQNTGRVGARFWPLERSRSVPIKMRFAAKNSSRRDCEAAKSGWYGKGMRDRYRLSGVGNEELLATLSALVRRENDLMSDVLAHLAELDERRLYLDLGYTSLFAYCTALASARNRGVFETGARPTRSPRIARVRCRRRWRARSMFVTTDAAHSAQRMGGAAARGDFWSSITSRRGRWAANRRSRTCASVVGLIISIRRGATSARRSSALWPRGTERARGRTPADFGDAQSSKPRDGGVA